MRIKARRLTSFLNTANVDRGSFAEGEFQGPLKGVVEDGFHHAQPKLHGFIRVLAGKFPPWFSWYIWECL